DALSLKGLLVRFVGAALLVYGTWNPEGYSFYAWAVAPFFGAPATPGPLPLKFLVGVLLLAAWGIYVTATRRSLGIPGTAIALAITGAVMWLLIDLDVMSATSSRGIGHVVLIALAILLTAGMSWSFVSRRMSGQVDTDVVE